MAEVLARVTYGDSRRQFVIRRVGEAANFSIEVKPGKDGGDRYVLATYPSPGKPPPGVSGIKLEIDEEAAQALVTNLLSAMFSRSSGQSRK